MHSSSNVIRLGTPAPLEDVRLGTGGLSATVERLVERARTEAHAAGVQSGLAEVGGLLDRLLDAVEEQRAELIDSAARTGVELGLEIARVLLQHETRVGNYNLERIVRETLRESGVGREECVVHLNADDLAVLTKVPFRTGTTLRECHDVARGEVQVDSRFGLLVRNLDGALASIAERLRGELS